MKCSSDKPVTLTLTPEQRKGLETILTWQQTKLCETLVDYASHNSLGDLYDFWSEMTDTLEALVWLTNLLTPDTTKRK